MRFLLTPAFLMLGAAAGAQPAGPPPPDRGLFLSPMGEPFRAKAPGADNVGAWIAGADRDGDGVLDLAELQADAARFFAALDTDRDGEIGPAEITRYENDVAPEVQLGLQMRGIGDGHGPGRRRRRVAVYDEGLDGAGRYAFLNIPHPVMAADFDMNRGISREEFARAAGQRFLLLDANRDGRLPRAELPPLPQPRFRRPARDDDAWGNPWRRPNGG